MHNILLQKFSPTSTPLAPPCFAVWKSLRNFALVQPPHEANHSFQNQSFLAMDTISKGKYVALAYKIFVVGTEQDVPVYELVEKHPDIFIFGYDFFMIEGFSKRIEGLKQGDTFDFTLTPDEAFGEKDPMLVLPLDKTLFHNADGEFDAERVALGQYVPMTLSNGQRAEGLVVDITDTQVTLDFNHQLAGETVRYQGKVLQVRDATEQELHPHQGCGSCGGSCGEGGCSGCSGCH